MHSIKLIYFNINTRTTSKHYHIMIPITNELIMACSLNTNAQDWNDISKNYILTEEFIKDFQDHVSWVWISQYQNLSTLFLEEFQEHINWFCISLNHNYTTKYIKKLRKLIRWNVSAWDNADSIYDDKVAWGKLYYDPTSPNGILPTMDCNCIDYNYVLELF